MSKQLIYDIASLSNLERAYQKARSGTTKYDKEAMLFAENETDNLLKIQKSLLDGMYEFSGYIRFTVHEPVERIVDAPHFVDKIVQLAILFKVKETIYNMFIYDSYACIDKKGTHKAVERVSHFLRKSYWEYGEYTVIIKADVRKFFYSINRDVLKGELKRIFKKKLYCKRTFKLMCKIIDSTDIIDELGLPLGNVLSQLESNIYMNRVDQFCKRKLGLKYYVRYADDMVICVENREKAEQALQELNNFIESELKLKLNKRKTKIFPIDQGVNAYGFKIYRTHRLLRNDSKTVIKRKAKKLPRLLYQGRISQEKVEQIFNSWYGHARYASSRNFINKLLDKHDYIYLTHKDVIKVDMSKIYQRGDLYVS